MKLRIVATSRDILIFLIFAIFLLYIVALAVLNIPQIAGEGTFYGLNPLEAFSPEYIKFTLFFYVIAIGGLFFSVSSYFFDFEQGFGLGVDAKSSGGYSSWAKEKDFKKDGKIKRIVASDPTSQYAGIPLICNGKEMWVDDGEYHNLVIGATGSGKTVNTILPTVKILAKKGESLICTDPKGEIYEKTGGLLKQKGYNIILLNFRNPQMGNSWNPLSLPYKLYKNGNQDKAIELLDDLALNILYEENSGNSDPFWEKTAADYFAGIALAMFEDTEEEKININSINMTATVGEDKFGGSTYIKEYFSYKEPSSAAYVNASGTVMAPSDTKGGIISVFKQKVKLFASRENLSEMLSYSDFDLADIGKKPTAVFIIIQDEKKTYHSLATIFIKQVYETLIDVAQQSGGKLPCRTNFLLDEFANMPPLKDVTTMITAARSRQIRFTLIIQNFAQLNKVYGKDDAETIKGNCGNIIYLISTELAALEEISKLCGEKKSKKDDKTASTPLATVSDLQRMKQFDQIILRLRNSPFKTSFVPDFKIDWGKCVSPKIEYPNREKRSVQIFDIREFVKEKKNKKLNDMMASMGGSSGGGVPNPFGGSGDIPPMPFGSSSPKKSNEISVNDLVKKIDQKLAEIEKEEQEQKKKKEQQAQTIVKKEETIVEKKVEPKVEKETVYFDKYNSKKNEDDEKEYYDDFMSSRNNHSKSEKIVSRELTSYDIENKVNSKLSDDILSEYDSDFESDLLNPIEKKKPSYVKENKEDVKPSKYDNRYENKYDYKFDSKKIDKEIQDDFKETREEIKESKVTNESKEFDKNIKDKANKSDYSKYDDYSILSDEELFNEVELLESEYSIYDDAKKAIDSEKDAMVSSLDKAFKEYKEKENVVVDNVGHPYENISKTTISEVENVEYSEFKPTPTIKLEDVSDDDKFFDDFFED